MSDTAEVLAGIVSEHTGIPPNDLTPATRWTEIGSDSLELVEIIMEAERVFGCDLPDAAYEFVGTFGELVALFEKSRARAA